MRDYALALIRDKYADFGPTLAAEVLAQQHGLEVSRETLRSWMMAAGLWLSRKQRRRFHQPRLRRESLGELVQIDGSEHRWFEERGDPCTLLVFIDDATGRLMQLHFVASESTAAYFEARFAVAPARPGDLHRPLDLSPGRLGDILCHRELRRVGEQLTLAYDRKLLLLARSAVAEAVAGQYVELYHYADGRLDVRWRGHSLPYSVFDKEQRVAQGEVVENKRLGAALALVRARQEMQRPPPRVLTSSEVGGYQSKPRRRAVLLSPAPPLAAPR